ncbi:DUF302 domain-containing protein [Dongia sp. agr-C8]
MAVVDGLTTIRSTFGPEETMNRFEAEVRASGMTVFTHIDHAAGAANAGLSLRPTDLLIFGIARTGTPLMEAAQSIAVDLPLRTLVWQDENGVTWLSYNQPGWLARRHGLGPAFDAIVATMTAGLDKMARAAAGA